jgi:hypothetical protein
MANHFSFRTFDFSRNRIMQSRGLDERGRVQQFIDSECLRLCDRKIPKDTGALIQSGIINTRIGSGQVIWRTPYARRLYYHPEYNFDQSPERGAYWFDRMKTQYKKQILSGAARLAGGRGNDNI